MKKKKISKKNKQQDHKEINNSIGGHISGASAKAGSNPNSFLDVEDYPL